MTLKTCAPKTTKLRQTDAFRLSLLAALLPVLLPAAQAEAAEGGIAIENCADSAACRLYDGSTNTPDDVYVGGMAHSQTQSGEELGWNRNASVTVERSTVDVDTAKAGFSIYGGFRGGVVENAAVTLKDSTFTLSSLETDKGYGNLYGAYVAAVFATTRDLTATGTRVTVDNTKLEGPNWNRLTTVMVDATAFGTLFAADDLFVDTVLKSSTGRPDGAFAAARGGRYTFDTRTRIDSNIFNAIFGYGLEVADGTELGGFIETGHASYDTETGGNDGSGTHNYAGAGLYLSQSLGLEGLRATAYVKGGMIRNDFDIRLADTQVDFEKSSAYWGAHAGLSYDWTPTAMLEARSFVNYFYDGRSSESYDFAGTDTVKGASFDYDALNGHRVQVGTPAGGLSEWMGSALRVFVRIRRRGQRRQSLLCVKRNAPSGPIFTESNEFHAPHLS